jgi:hypothetical protein
MMNGPINDMSLDRGSTVPGHNMNIEVRCYSGYTYAEEPRSFVWQDRELRVESIERAWQEPGRRLFRVVTHNGELFELCYNEADERWCAVELTTFQESS